MNNDEFKLGVGQAHEFELALNRVGGWNPARLKLLCEGDRLARVLEYTLGLAEIKPIEHFINCDATPLIPRGWKILSEDQLPNRVTGSLKWEKDQTKLYLSESQRQGKFINGHELKKKLVNKQVLPANVLDYLLANKHLIPGEWKGKLVFFWGTIYRDSDGNLSVRCLEWNRGGGWGYSYGYGCIWVDDGWFDSGPVAIRAS